MSGGKYKRYMKRQIHIEVIFVTKMGRLCPINALTNNPQVKIYSKKFHDFSDEKVFSTKQKKGKISGTLINTELESKV